VKKEGITTEDTDVEARAMRAARRSGSANSKTKAEVDLSGAKPWRQKGTGRARFGSSRNPIWTGGGVAFGPTGNENYKKQLNVKAKRQAIRQALTAATAANKVAVIEDIKASGKTTELAKLLTKIEATRNVLLVVGDKTPEMIRASRNLANTKVVAAKYVNVYDVLNADSVVFTNAALAAVTEWLGGN